MPQTATTTVSPQKAKRKHTKTKKIWTYKDYLKLDDDKRYEVIEGELIMVPAPFVIHQRFSRRIEFLMLKFVEENKLGEVFYAPVDVVFGKKTVLQPDILFVSNERKSIITKRAVEGAPDLVVEILSPSSSYNDTVRKKRIYAENDVLEYWIVDPEDKSIEIFENRNNHFYPIDYAHLEGKVSSKILDGFSVDIEEIFGE